MECSSCSERPDFLEPCPSCGGEGTYVPHETTGFPQCHGCEPTICTECAYGARYMCDYFRAKRDMPAAPPKLERQINEVYWEIAEDILVMDTALEEVKVQHIPGKYIYVVQRDADGQIRRVSSSEVCSRCSDVDIRREIYEPLYAELGTFACENCLAILQCSSGLSSSQRLSSSSICGDLGSP